MVHFRTVLKTAFNDLAIFYDYGVGDVWIFQNRNILQGLTVNEQQIGNPTFENLAEAAVFVQLSGHVYYAGAFRCRVTQDFCRCPVFCACRETLLGAHRKKLPAGRIFPPSV